MMTNEEILETAMAQSAIDANCSADDFKKSENKIVFSQKNPRARRYLELPLACNLISYGNNIVASIDRKYESIVRDYIEKYPVEHCFETPNMHVLNEAFEPYGMKVCFMAEYFLPDVRALTKNACPYPVQMQEKEALEMFDAKQWPNALNGSRDVLGFAAYKNQQMIGMAACSQDCGSMWQIGVDVLPKFRQQGIASALTAALAWEILDRGKVPFYCCAWSNIKSARNAIKSGFRPAWVETTVKTKEFTDKMNGLV